MTDNKSWEENNYSQEVIAKRISDLEVEKYRLTKALDLALYYVEGDSAWEGLKVKIDKILRGEE